MKYSLILCPVGKFLQAFNGNNCDRSLTNADAFNYNHSKVDVTALEALPTICILARSLRCGAVRRSPGLTLI